MALPRKFSQRQCSMFPDGSCYDTVFESVIKDRWLVFDVLYSNVASVLVLRLNGSKEWFETCERSFCVQIPVVDDVCGWREDVDVLRELARRAHRYQHYYDGPARTWQLTELWIPDLEPVDSNS